MVFKKSNRRLDVSVNAGSMADIAFLLLIFFLVTTTILMDEGIHVLLPPWEEDSLVQDIPSRNIFNVLINKNDELLIEGKPALLHQLKGRAKEFIMNPAKRDDLPKNPKRAVISILNDRGTSYNAYLEVYNELKAAYNELWEEEAKLLYQQAYDDLSRKDQRAIRAMIPLIISEAEPIDLAEN